MDQFLLWMGRLAGAVGALLCVLAITTRASGTFAMGGFQVGTLLLAGVAAMVAGCLCLLVTLTNRTLR